MLPQPDLDIQNKSNFCHTFTEQYHVLYVMMSNPQASQNIIYFFVSHPWQRSVFGTQLWQMRSRYQLRFSNLPWRGNKQLLAAQPGKALSLMQKRAYAHTTVPEWGIMGMTHDIAVSQRFSWKRLRACLQAGGSWALKGAYGTHAQGRRLVRPGWD